MGEVSEKKRKFASNLSKRLKLSKKAPVKNDEYLVRFYEIIAPKNVKKERVMNNHLDSCTTECRLSDGSDTM